MRLSARIAFAVCAIGVGLASVSHASAAVLNKAAPNRCGDKDHKEACDSVAEIARSFLKGSELGQLATIIHALVAAFLLCAIASMVLGWVALAQGMPGGGQKLLAGSVGLVVVIAMIGVVL